MTHHERQRRTYKRLPPDSELFALWRSHAYSYVATAAEIGCTPSAIQQRVRRAGLEKPPGTARYSAPRLETVVIPPPTDEDKLSNALRRIGVLENRLRSLQNELKQLKNRQDQPKTAQISTKRIQDGGEHASTQRKRLNQPKMRRNRPDVADIA